MVFIIILTKFFFAGGSGFFLDLINSHLTLLLGVSKNSIFHTVSGDFAAERKNIIRYLNEIEFFLWFTTKLGQFFLSFNNILNRLVSIFEGFHETIFRNLVSRSLNHHHLFLATYIDKVESGVVHLLVGRIDHKFSVDLSEAYATDRTIPWHIRDHECSRRTINHEHIGFVYQIS